MAMERWQNNEDSLKKTVDLKDISGQSQFSDILKRSPNQIFRVENGLLSVFEKKRAVTGLGEFLHISILSTHAKQCTCHTYV